MKALHLGDRILVRAKFGQKKKLEVMNKNYTGRQAANSLMQTLREALEEGQRGREI